MFLGCVLSIWECLIAVLLIKPLNAATLWFHHIIRRECVLLSACMTVFCPCSVCFVCSSCISTSLSVPVLCADSHKPADKHVSFSRVNFTGLSRSSELTNQ